MAEESQKQSVASFRFRANLKSPTVEIHEGEYRRLFQESEQPFAATTVEEAARLRKDPNFVELKGDAALEAEKKPDVTAPTEAANEENPSGSDSPKKSKAALQSPKTKVEAPPAAE